MSVLIQAKDLLIGNGSLYLNAGGISALPTLAQFKTYYNAGTENTGTSLSQGYVGGIKGTATATMRRDLVKYELGIPQEVGDQTCIREGVHFKVAASELNLTRVLQQLGGGLYSTVSAAMTHYTDVLTITTGIGTGLSHGPVAYTTDTTPATANPVLTSVTAVQAFSASGASIPFTTSATGTGTLTGTTPFHSSATVTLTVGGTYADGQTYTLSIANGLYTVSYTSQAGDTNNTGVAVGLNKAINGTVATGAVSNIFVSAAISSTTSTNTVVVTQNAYLQGYDYIIDSGSHIIELLPNGTAKTHSGTAGYFQLDYYVNQAAIEQFTMGGQAVVNQVALAFFHPYKDGRVMAFYIRKCNPTGTMALAFEETAYSSPEVEFEGIADFTQAPGAHLLLIQREVPS